jgi:hypothetical protein
MVWCVLENTWLKGIMDHGWGNGYVVIPPGHPLHGKGYTEINEHIIIHGGLTHSGYVFNGFWWQNLPYNAHPEGWVVGFDTAHYGDNIKIWSKEAVIMETGRLAGQLIKFKLEHDEKNMKMEKV